MMVLIISVGFDKGGILPGSQVNTNLIDKTAKEFEDGDSIPINQEQTSYFMDAKHVYQNGLEKTQGIISACKKS